MCIVVVFRHTYPVYSGVRLKTIPNNEQEMALKGKQIDIEKNKII